MREKAIDFKWIWMLMSAATLLAAYFTFHDMQTSEGIGLYFAIRAGRENLQLFDFLVDGAGMFCLCAAILLPCLLSGHLRPDSFLRLLSAYLAFMPTVSAASLVHLADGTEKIVFLGAGTVKAWGMEGILPALAVGVPLLILFSAVERRSGAGRVKRPEEEEASQRLKGAKHMLQWEGDFGGGKGASIAGKWFAGAVCLLLLLIAVLFPALGEQCAFFFAYVLLVYGFCLWERLWDEKPGRKHSGWLLFGIFWLRGIERMIEVMSIYHI